MTLGALLHPLMLARTIATMLVAAVLVRACIVALSALRSAGAPAGSEQAVRVARQTEIVCATVELALFASTLGAVSLVLAADRIAPMLPGAMCAYGVFDATPWGFFALASSFVLSFASAAWLVLHRLDLRLRAPSLTPAKLVAAMLLAPLGVLDAVAHLAFSTTLDLSTTVSCCSSSFDALVVETTAEAGPMLRSTAAIAAALLGLGAISGALAVRAEASRARQIVAAALGLAASATSAFAIVTYVAPHVYEAPTHACPFCLLGELGHFLGWPLLTLWWLGTASSLAFAVLARYGTHGEAGEAARAQARSLSLAAAIAWTLLLALTTFPVVRFLIRSGGMDLFGGE